MRDLLRADLARLFRNKLLYLGTVCAFAITFWFTGQAKYMNILSRPETDFDYSLLASLGIPAFLAVFTPLFIGVEYRDGTIRNKLITGKTRTQIYLSSVIVTALAVLIMTAAWLAGAATGADTLPSAGVIAISTAKTIAYNIAGISVLVLISYAVTNYQNALGFEFTLFQTGAFGALALQGLMVIAANPIMPLLKFILNLNPLGQWLLDSPIGDYEAKLPVPVQFAMSVFILAAMTFFGIRMLNKKDIR